MADLNYLIDSAKKSSKIYYSMEYGDKTQEEITQLYHEKNKFFIRHPLPQTMQEMTEYAHLQGELEVINELYAMYQEQEKKAADSLKAWEKSLKSRVESAMLNVSFAATYPAQLIIALLENEDGQTAEQISQWDDALSSMNTEDFNQLLSNLVKARLLAFDSNNEKYYYLTHCTENMFPVDTKRWAKTIKLTTKEERITKDDLLLEGIEDLKLDDQPNNELTDDEIMLLNELDFGGKPLLAGSVEPYWVLSGLVKRGILQVYPIKSVGNNPVELYYYPMIGENIGGKSK